MTDGEEMSSSLFVQVAMRHWIMIISLFVFHSCMYTDYREVSQIKLRWDRAMCLKHNEKELNKERY